MSLRIGVLALQGDFVEHAAVIRRLGATASEIRRSSEVADIDGLIIPGGESTAIDKLMADNQDPIFDTILAYARKGLPIYGTCMGSIFLAKEIEGSTQGRLALMDICVKRNAFGPQRFSFETSLDIPALGPQPFPAVFIRGPIITSASSNVEILSSINEGIVMARQNNLLVTAFHPEITNDLRVHQLFLSMVVEAAGRRPAASELAHTICQSE